MKKKPQAPLPKAYRVFLKREKALRGEGRLGAGRGLEELWSLEKSSLLTANDCY